MSKKLLFKSKWINVYEYDSWFTAIEQPQGDGVAILVVDSTREQVLVRLEHKPCHGIGVRQTSFTGTIEKNMSPIETAQKELLEEAGYLADLADFQYLGWVYPNKVSNYKQHLYSIDVAGLIQGPIEGDGTRGEAGAGAEWVSMQEALEINELSISACLARLALIGDFREYSGYLSR